MLLIRSLENPKAQRVRTDKFSKVGGYKVTRQKSDTFLDTKSKQFEKEITKHSIYNSTEKNIILKI